MVVGRSMVVRRSIVKHVMYYSNQVLVLRKHCLPFSCLALWVRNKFKHLSSFYSTSAGDPYISSNRSTTIE
jgi:hypothetical protein